MNERWRIAHNVNGLYQVSDFGRVRRDGRILKGSAAGKGYRKIILCVAGTRQHKYIHELVLEIFVGPRPQGMEAAHNNGQRDDNRLANLRWDTRSGNFADKQKHGTATAGERHSRRKLSAPDVLTIRASTGSCKEVGDYYGVCPTQISRIRTGKNWKCL
jgi:hypothetical protein